MNLPTRQSSMLPLLSISATATATAAFLFLLTLSVLTSTPSNALMSDVIFPPKTVAGPYWPERGGTMETMFFMNIIGENSMSGSMVYTISYISQVLPVTDYLNGIPYYQTEIVLPHESDDIFGCSTNFNTQNEFNESFVGKAVMLRRGLCAGGLVAKRAEAMNASTVLIAGCPTAAPFNCNPNVEIVHGAQHINLPALVLTTADGVTLENYLVSRRNARKAAALNATLGLPITYIPGPIYMRSISSGPMDPVELEAMRNIGRLTYINPDTTVRIPLGGLPVIDMAFANSTTADPCLVRYAGMWCENGHLVYLNIPVMEWQDRNKAAVTAGTAVSGLAQVGAFTQLKFLNLPNNFFTGPLPDTFCSCTQVRYLGINNQGSGKGDGFTSLPPCLGRMTQLYQFYALQNSIAGQFPDLSNATKLYILDMSFNLISSLPPSFGSWKSVYALDASSNALTELPRVSGLNKTYWMSFANNQINTVMNTSHFDGLAGLQYVDLSNNQISGTLPSFTGCKKLVILQLSQNQFNSSIPVNWVTDIPLLQSLKVNWNQLVSPITHLSQMSNLITIELQHNKLTLVTPGSNSNDIGVYFPAGPATTTMKLDYNQLAGIWSEGSMKNAKKISVITLSHNAITNLPVLIFSYPLTYLDMSYNNLSVWDNSADSPLSALTYLNLQGNPNLHPAVRKTWLTTGTQMLLDSTETYLCPELGSTSNLVMKVLLDPIFTSFSGCRCNKGTFGIAPRCYPVPLTSTLKSADAQVISEEVGADFRDLIELTSGRSGRTMNGSTSTNSTKSTTDSTILPPTSWTSGVDTSVSDAWYGQSRLTKGLSTSWMIDLTDDRSNGDGTGEPVRYITLYIHLSLKLFVDPTDQLSIFEGDASMASVRVAMLRGTDPVPDQTDDIAWAQTDEYKTQYAVELASLAPSPVSVWVVRVFGPLSTIFFASRDENGTHFFSTYTKSYSCPSGYFLDQDMQRCRPNLEVYQVSDAAVDAVFAVSALAIGFNVVALFVVLVYFNSPIIRAASRMFLLLMVCLLLLLSGGSILYAIVPDATKTSQREADTLCQARGWLTAWPLTGVFGILLAKTNRISEIFTSQQLQLRTISDMQILGTVGAVVSVVTVLLGVWSGLPLTSAQAHEGSGSLLNHLVRKCATETGFGAWIVVLLIFLACLLLAATYLSFKTKDIPSRFNESSHIMNAVLLCLFYACLIIPLTFFIQDNPDSAVLIQGVGQALGSLLLSATIFLPKIYYIIIGGDRGVTNSIVVTKADNATNNNASSINTGSNPVTRPPSSSIMSRPVPLSRPSPLSTQQQPGMSPKNNIGLPVAVVPTRARGSSAGNNGSAVGSPSSVLSPKVSPTILSPKGSPTNRAGQTFSARRQQSPDNNIARQIAPFNRMNLSVDIDTASQSPPATASPPSSGRVSVSASANASPISASPGAQASSPAPGESVPAHYIVAGSSTNGVEMSAITPTVSE